jgi:hypothetical protein
VFLRTCIERTARHGRCRSPLPTFSDFQQGDEVGEKTFGHAQVNHESDAKTFELRLSQFSNSFNPTPRQPSLRRDNRRLGCKLPAPRGLIRSFH